MKNIFIILSVLLIFKVNGQNESFFIDIKTKQPFSISNTIWECKIADECLNRYKFNIDSSYVFYSCEFDEEFFGKYYFLRDSLILEESGSVNDSIYKRNSIHIKGQKKYWILINGNEFTHKKMSIWNDSVYIDSKFKFNSKYKYIKK